MSTQRGVGRTTRTALLVLGALAAQLAGPLLGVAGGLVGPPRLVVSEPMPESASQPQTSTAPQTEEPEGAPAPSEQPPREQLPTERTGQGEQGDGAGDGAATQGTAGEQEPLPDACAGEPPSDPEGCATALAEIVLAPLACATDPSSCPPPPEPIASCLDGADCPADPVSHCAPGGPGPACPQQVQDGWGTAAEALCDPYGWIPDCTPSPGKAVSAGCDALGEAWAGCEQGLGACVAADLAACQDAVRDLVIDTLCDVGPATCLEAFDEVVRQCDGDLGCVAAEVAVEACRRAGPSGCPWEEQTVEQCLRSGAAAPCTAPAHWQRWAHLSCREQRNATLRTTYCSDNPIINNAGAQVSTDAGKVDKPRFGSRDYPYATVAEGLNAVRTGWMVSPVDVHGGGVAYGATVVLGPSTLPTDLATFHLRGVTVGGQAPVLASTAAGQPALRIQAGLTPDLLVTGIRLQAPAGTQAIEGPVVTAAVSDGPSRVGPDAVVSHLVEVAEVSDEAIAVPEPLSATLWLVDVVNAGLEGFAVEASVDGGPFEPLSLTHDGRGLSATLWQTPAGAPVPSGFLRPTVVRVRTGAEAVYRLEVAVDGAGGTGVRYAEAVGTPTTVGMRGSPETPLPAPPSDPPVPDGVFGPEPPRLAGQDRAATAAAIARSSFDAADTVMLANGDGYADALSGGPAAARSQAPVLLVGADHLPPATDEELRRLRPSRVVLLGGPGAIGPEVEAAVAAQGADVERLAGSDRYATAAAVSAASFDPDAPVAYVATGQDFADGLAGGAAAALHGGPILLVRRDAVPESTGAELRRLRPGRIVVLGGPGAVSEEVAVQLRVYTPGDVRRLSGSDRYATATAVSRHAFPEGAGVVYVATGQTYPDALAGVAAAGLRGAPLLLVEQNRLPEVVAIELERLRPRQLVVLGGEHAVSRRLQRELWSYQVPR